MQGLNQFLLLDAVDHGRVLLVPVLPLRLSKSGYGLKWRKVHGGMQNKMRFFQDYKEGSNEA